MQTQTQVGWLKGGFIELVEDESCWWMAGCWKTADGVVRLAGGTGDLGNRRSKSQYKHWKKNAALESNSSKNAELPESC